MSFLLDTCIFSEFRKPTPEPKVVEWLSGQLEDRLYLSVITLGEIQKGISRLESSRKRAELETWFQALIVRYHGRILGIGTDEMLVWGETTSRLELEGRVLPFMDSLIAATSIANNLILVTRNAGDFKETGVEILNPWI